MTSQKDPGRRAAQDYMRRDNGSWSVLPIVLGVAFLALLGYLFLGPGFNTTPNRSVTGQRTEVPNSTVNAPTPTPAKPQ